MSNDKLYKTFAKRLVNELGVKVSGDFITKYYLHNPKFPNYSALISFLGSLRIRTKFVKVEAINLELLPIPFVTYTKFSPANLLLVKVVENGFIFWIDTTGQEQRYSIEQFSAIHSGNVLVIEADESSGEENYKVSNYISELNRFKPLLAVLTFPALFNLLTSALTIKGLLPFLCLNVLGMLICFLLSNKVVQLNSSYINRLCSLNSDFSCDDVLNSTYSKFLGIFSWVEIGLIYFSTNTLVLIIHPSLGIIFIISWLYKLSTIYVIYSLYIQAFVLKRFCILCLGTLAVLVSGYAFTLIRINILINYYDVIQAAKNFLLVLVLVVAVWTLLKQVTYQSIQNKKLKYEVNAIKYGPLALKALVINSHPIPCDLVRDIHFGNEHGLNEITLVLSPFCSVCGETHKQLMSLLFTHGEYIRFNLVIAVKDVVADVIATSVLKYYYEEGKFATLNILKEWFALKNKNPSFWKPIKSANDEKHLFTNIALQHNYWCINMAYVSKAPAIFLNGYRLPAGYTLADAVYLLD